MKLEDYDCGKPLTARRISIVKTAVEQVVANAKHYGDKAIETLVFCNVGKRSDMNEERFAALSKTVLYCLVMIHPRSMASMKIHLVLLAVACTAMAFDWTGYTLKEEKLPPVSIVNSNFENGSEGWKLADEHKVVRGEGINLSSGLVIERTDPNRYNLCTQSAKGCVPGYRYNISAHVRCENIQGGKMGATIGIEHSDKDGKFISLSGTYLTGLYGTQDWTELNIRSHVISKNAGNTSIILFLGEKSTGKAYYDEVNIWPDIPSWTIYYPQTTQGFLPADTPLEARITTSDGGVPAANLKAAVSFQGGDDLIAPIVEGKAVFPQTVSWKGKGTLRIRVFDEAAKAILTEQTTDLRIGVDIPSVYFDSRGRTLVDGKRFLPIGIFGNISNRRTVNIIHDAGFNTLLPCNTVHMGLENTRGYEGHQAAMDYCQEKGMKVILCFRGVYSWSANAWMKHGVLGEFAPDKIVENIVTRLYNHPALLAYYTADEVSPVHIPDLTARYRQLHELDPNHPVYQVHSLGYNTNSFIPYGPCCDVIGVDHYPFSNPEKSDLTKMGGKLEEAKKSGLPQWFVPQAMNWRRWNAKRADATFPSMEEYRAQILHAAGCGMKAFIFYTYHPLIENNPAIDGTDAKTVIKIMKNGNAVLRYMEPFILSDNEPQKLPVTVKSGKVAAWKFTDDAGNVRIAVISLAPGDNVAELALPKRLSPIWGNAKVEGNKAVFTKKNIGCELFVAPKN